MLKYIQSKSMEKLRENKKWWMKYIKEEALRKNK